jgi:signal peptidase II
MLKQILSTGFKWLWVAILIIAIDRYSKTWMLDHLNLLDPLEILPIFNFTLAFNKGAAFSFLNTASGWQNLLLSSFATIVCGIIFYWLYQTSAKERWLSVAYCLIIGGAVGNMWDRMRYGFVVDFLDFHLTTWHFAIFNVADSAICVGAFMLFWHWIKTERR